MSLRGDAVAMTMSGFCTYPSPGSHNHCQTTDLRCTCPCHTDHAAYDDGHTIGDQIEIVLDDEDDGI